MIVYHVVWYPDDPREHAAEDRGIFGTLLRAKGSALWHKDELGWWREFGDGRLTITERTVR